MRQTFNLQFGLFQQTAVVSQKLDLSLTHSVTLVLKKCNLAHDSS